MASAGPQIQPIGNETDLKITADPNQVAGIRDGAHDAHGDYARRNGRNTGPPGTYNADTYRGNEDKGHTVDGFSSYPRDADVGLSLCCQPHASGKPPGTDSPKRDVCQ
jgi:hypothetical protein